MTEGHLLDGFGLGFDAVFHAEARAFDDDGLGMMEEAVEDGGGDGGVTVKDGCPLLEGFVGGEYDGATFVTCADNLEEEIGPALIDGKVSDLIQNEERWGEVSAQLGFERAFGMCGAEGVDNVDGVGKEYAHALLTGGIAECRGEMGFAEADESQEDDVRLVVDELETEQVLDLETVDFLGPVPAEGVESFYDREPRGPDAPGDSAVGIQCGFALDELGQIVEMGNGVFGGGGGQGLAVLFEERQTQGVESGVKGGEVVFGFHGLS